MSTLGDVLYIRVFHIKQEFVRIYGDVTSSTERNLRK